jgi:hypothetical protein
MNEDEKGGEGLRGRRRQPKEEGGLGVCVPVVSVPLTFV